MSENKLIQRLIFDSILIAIFFLPIFTAIFLWNIFFYSSRDVVVIAPKIPQLNTTDLNQVQATLKDRRHAARAIEASSSMSFGLLDPFRP